MYLFEYDLAVLNEMQDQIQQATGKSKTDAKSAYERVKQRRAGRATPEISDGGVVELLKQRGIPVQE